MFKAKMPMSDDLLVLVDESHIVLFERDKTIAALCEAVKEFEDREVDGNDVGKWLVAAIVNLKARLINGGEKPATALIAAKALRQQGRQLIRLVFIDNQDFVREAEGLWFLNTEVIDLTR